MLLRELVVAASGASAVNLAGEIDIVDVVHDTRDPMEGALFACVRGATVDGHTLAERAVDAGAVALLVDHALDIDVPQIVVDDTRRAMSTLASACHGDPSSSLTVVGVTGTNGKTTSTHLLANIMRAAGRPVEVIGTLSGARTTPEAPDLQRRLARIRDDGGDVVAMEVSSHAIDQHRVDDVHFRVAAFTNLTRDHLDWHGTMEAYFASKARLFDADRADLAVIDVDGPYGRLLADTVTIPVATCSLDEIDSIELGPDVSACTWRGRRVHLPLGGRFNLSNAILAAHVASELGVDDATIVEGLALPLVVPGRFEAVHAGQPFPIIVDYAHTPDGLEKVLAAASELVAPSPGARVLVVFGCGGDRDPSKRPQMGQAAAAGADVVVLTSDNSRSESTSDIMGAVLEGIDRLHPRRAALVVAEPDRRAAIGTALAEARPGDIVVIAGKGHETTQTIGERTTEFDDRVVAAEQWRSIA